MQKSGGVLGSLTTIDAVPMENEVKQILHIPTLVFIVLININTHTSMTIKIERYSNFPTI